MIRTFGEFNSLDLSERIDFWKEGFPTFSKQVSSGEQYRIIKKIILNETENSYVRKIAVHNLVNLILINKLKVRHGLSILIDDWGEISNEVFLELERCKSLFLFYNEEPEQIESIFNNYLNHVEGELLAEAHYQLGIINFQKALEKSSSKTLLKLLKASQNHFDKANNVIENRVDAKIFSLVVKVLSEILNNKWGGVDTTLKTLSALLFKKKAFTFNERKGMMEDEEPFYYGIYICLLNLKKIYKEKPDQWLDFREQIDRIYYNYCQIFDQKLDYRLNKSVTRELYLDVLEQKFLKPYFRLNFEGEKSRINKLLHEISDDNPKYDFLIDIKETLKEGNQKKKDSETLFLKFKNFFPNKSDKFLKDVTRKVEDFESLITAYESCTKPDLDFFTNTVYSRVARLQGDKKYWGKCHEDDRNTYIANMLDSAGAQIKDQTRWSVSAGGKAPGELDIYVQEVDGTPYSIIEGINLKSVNKREIQEHLQKIFVYDNIGLENNYILVYSTAKNFSPFCERYFDYIAKINYDYSLVEIQETEHDHAELDMRKATHTRNGKKVYLYHIIANLAER